MYKDQVSQDQGRFRLLTEVSQEIISILDINDLLGRVVRLIQQTFDYYHVGIGLIEGNEVVYRVGAGSLWDDPDFQFKPARLKVGEEGISGWVAHTGQAALVPDVTRDARYVWMQGSQTRSELTVPIIVKGKTIGVLDVQSQHIDDFDQNDLELMQAIANQTGIAIENARLFSQTGRRAEQFRVLTEVSQQIISLASVDELLNRVAQLVKDTFGYVHVGIGLVAGDRVISKAEVGAFEDAYRAISIPLGEGIWGRVAKEGISLFSSQVNGEKHHKYMHQVGIHSHLCVPLKTKDKAVGVMSAASDRAEAFNQSDEIILQTLANQVSVAIENARLFAETQHLLKETEQRASELAIINRVQQELASKLDAQSIYELVGDTFHNFFNAQVVVISAYDEKSNTVEHHYAIERWRRIPWPGTHPPGGFRSHIIHTKQPFLVNTNVEEEAARLGQPILSGTNMPRSWLGVPILVGDQVTGILSVQNVDEENAFSESDVRLLQTFAASMSIALENARLYEQARHLAVSDERQRLARELHDSVTQSLYGISLYAQAATGKIDASQVEQAREYIENIQNTSLESLADMRLLIYELRPPILDKEGLVSALQSRLSAVENRANIKSSIKSNLTSRLHSDVEEGLYQIAREALNNIIKHADAKNISIRIGRKPDSVSMEISDDGIGFDVENAHREGCLGLINMQEHARSQGWRLNIESTPGNGTRVKVEMKQP